MPAVVRALAAVDDSAAGLERTLMRVGEALGLEVLLHYQPSAQTGKLELVASAGLTAEIWALRGRLELGEYSCGRVAQTRERIIMEDSDEALANSAALGVDGVRCYAGIPLVERGHLLGTLAFATRARGKFRAHEIELVESVASLVALHLARLAAERRLERASKDLFVSHERFKQFAETMPAMIFTADTMGTLTFHNGEWLAYTGLAELPPGPEGICAAAHVDDRQPCLRAWTEALATGSPFEIELRNLGANGDYRWFSVRARPLRDMQGRLVEWCGVTTDIHDRKTVAESLRAAELRKDEFLAILAHELRNPLAPIRNAVQVLKTAAGNRPTAGNAVEIIERQVTYLARLVDDVLDVARMDRGKVALKSDVVDFAAVVRHAIETCRPLCAAARHELVVTLPEGSLHVSGDATRLTQVAGNLLSNAAKFTAAGGRIEVTLEREEVHDGAAILRVRDNGRGMDRATLERVFDMFYQGHRGTERPTGGLGIGLALVKSIVMLHGGRVEALSQGRGRGSELIVRLPCAPEAAAVRRL